MGPSRRGQRADDEARLIEEHLATVRKVCRARLSRRGDIDDAIQETFIQFLLADRSRIANLDAWLTTVAARTCGHLHRWRFAHPEEELLDDLENTTSDDDLEDVIDAVWFERIVSRLPEMDRHVLTWLYLEKLSRESVAEHLGVSTDHLRVIAYRARRRAHRMLSAFDDSMGL